MNSIGSFTILMLLTKLFLFVAAYIYLQVKKPFIGKYLRPILIVLIIRLFIFENPLSWHFYSELLPSSSTVRPPKGSIIFNEGHFKLDVRKNAHYLAFGNSQIAPLYSEHLSLFKRPELFLVLGSSPLELLLYRKEIDRLRPEVLLLNISEFDLASLNNLQVSQDAPTQGLYAIKILPKLLEVAKRRGKYQPLQYMFAGELFPEYKWSSFFKALLNYFLGEVPYINNQREKDKKVLPPEILASSLIAMQNQSNIKTNLFFLKESLEYFKIKKQSILIVQGQVNPLVYAPKVKRVNEEVYDRLVALDHEFENVLFIPKSKLINFTEDDYTDFFHVRLPVGLKYSQHLFDLIDSEIRVKNGKIEWKK